MILIFFQVRICQTELEKYEEFLQVKDVLNLKDFLGLLIANLNRQLLVSTVHQITTEIVERTSCIREMIPGIT